jgi:hypothetical protein
MRGKLRVLRVGKSSYHIPDMYDYSIQPVHAPLGALCPTSNISQLGIHVLLSLGCQIWCKVKIFWERYIILELLKTGGEGNYGGF